MKADFEDDNDLLDEDSVEEEEIPDVKMTQSQAWRDIESKREERALLKRLEKEYDLGGLDDWDE
ncbi:MAG: PA3496 family putative envelope integrity protein [Wohlfahrtiimonas sp.]